GMRGGVVRAVVRLRRDDDPCRQPSLPAPPERLAEQVARHLDRRAIIEGMWQWRKGVFCHWVFLVILLRTGRFSIATDTATPRPLAQALAISRNRRRFISVSVFWT